MNKLKLKPSTLLSPVPVVMVTSGDRNVSNIITVAWVGTVNSEPPMVSISVRKERYSHTLIDKYNSFAINMVSKDLVKGTDFCGVKSGKNIDKFEECGFTKVFGDETEVPMILESPVNIECKVVKVLPLGSHDMYIGEIVGVYASESLADEKGRLDFEKAELVAYCHGEYFALNEKLGFFGYSVASEEVLNRRMNK